MISILVPFRATSNSVRGLNWRWIEKRWKYVLPEAELVIGVDDGEPFSKAAAVNDAYRKSSGDTLIVCDADTWIERRDIDYAIGEAWRFHQVVVPWQTCHRFGRKGSVMVRKTSPVKPLAITTGMLAVDTDEANPSPESIAMIYVIQRQCFELIGGMDPRFRGWGSEDTSFGLAGWTLLGPTVFTNGTVYSLWHPRPRRDKTSDVRVWDNDEGLRNEALWGRYAAALGHPHEMAALCREHSLGPAVGVHPLLTHVLAPAIPDAPIPVPNAAPETVYAGEEHAPYHEGDTVRV